MNTLFKFVATSTPITSETWKSIIDAMTAQLSVATVVEVLAALVTACITFVFLWWGVRKTSRAIMRAFTKGKLRL